MVIEIYYELFKFFHCADMLSSGGGIEKERKHTLDEMNKYKIKT